MDQVKIGMDEPQEDEYAIYRITSYSPLEHLVFPRSAHYFLDQNTEFLPPREKLGQWKSDLQDFYRKLHFFSHKRIISKNPFNSFRIDLLQEMFPKAKFINIIRNPLNVVPSTINMWDIIGKQNTLTNLHVKPTVDEVITFYDRLLKTVEQAQNQFIPGTFAEIRYEDLERDPVTELSKLYHTLNLSFTPEHKEKLNEFVMSASDYKKNTFQLDEENTHLIRERLARFMEQKNYQ
jgi:hypothetical protein